MTKSQFSTFSCERANLKTFTLYSCSLTLEVGFWQHATSEFPSSRQFSKLTSFCQSAASKSIDKASLLSNFISGATKKLFSMVDLSTAQNVGESATADS